MLYTTLYSSPLGSITLASDGEALTGLWFEGQKNYPLHLEQSRRDSALPVFRQARAWLDLYFAGGDPGAVPLLRPGGSPFQTRVWTLLSAIPYGATRTYGELAAALSSASGQPRMSAQAVGGAVGKNPLSILIPCHRVVGTNGSLTGYAGGLDRKIALLKLEGAFRDTFFVPRRSTAP